MNNKKFDSFIKNSLSEHDSHVPAEMWKRIQLEKDFDPFIKQSLDNLSSNVPAEMWNRIKAEKDFDPFIKRNLDNHSSAIPANMWNRIQSEKKKDRRPFAWWWATAVLLLLLSSTTIWFFTKKSSPSNGAVTNKTIAPEAKDALTTNTNAPIVKHLPNTTAPSQEVTKQQKTNVSDTFMNTIQQSKTAQSNKIPFSHNNQPNNNKRLSNPQKQSANQQPFNQKTSVLQAIKNKLPQKNKENMGLGTTPENELDNLFSNKKDIAQTLNTNSSGNYFYEKQKNTTLKGVDNNNQPTEVFTLQIDNKNNNTEKQLSLDKLIVASFTKDKMMPKQLLHVMAKNTVIACPPLGRTGRNDWYIEAFVSPEIVMKTLQDKPFGKNIQSGMDSTLQRQISFSAGINIVKNLGENWLIKTGVHYAQINELFKYSSVNEIKTTTVITVRNVIISPGDTLFIRDTSTVQTVGSITKQTQNHYHQWNIPIIFSYEFGGKDLRLNANFGIMANIRSSYQGNMLDTLQKMINISNYNNMGIYKTNLGISAYLGVGMIKPINDNMDFLIESHALFNLRNITTSSALFNQKNTILGLSLGIRYKINGNGQR